MILKVWRWTQISFLLFSFISLGVLLFLIGGKHKRHLATRWSSFCAKLVMNTLGIQIVAAQSELMKGRLVVSNHMSYVDAIILAAMAPCVFVTSREVESSPGLGLLAKIAGCLFVERRHREQVAMDIEQIKVVLQEGFTVVLFPEGTSTNGEVILPFKKSLFDAAIDLELEVLPVSLNYIEINREVVSKSNRDLVCYYGDMEFCAHFAGLVNQVHSLRALVHVSEPILTTQIKCRRAVAEKAYQDIAVNFYPTG